MRNWLYADRSHYLCSYALHAPSKGLSVIAPVDAGGNFSVCVFLAPGASVRRVWWVPASAAHGASVLKVNDTYLGGCPFTSMKYMYAHIRIDPKVDLERIYEITSNILHMRADFSDIIWSVTAHIENICVKYLPIAPGRREGFKLVELSNKIPRQRRSPTKIEYNEFVEAAKASHKKMKNLPWVR